MTTHDMTSRGRSAALILLALTCHGCGADEGPPDSGAVVDSLDADVPSGQRFVRDSAAPADVGPIGCDLGAVGQVFDEAVRPGLSGCQVCHDMTLHSGVLKAPGPQWYHPTDSVAVLRFLLDNDLVDGDEPAVSRFLLKPLPPTCGGLGHTGGDGMACDDETHGGFLSFLGTAASCVR